MGTALRRTDIKAYFANERTFLHWTHMSITIGSISSAILGLTENSFKVKDPLFHTVKVLCIFMLTVAIILSLMTLVTFSRRNRALSNHLDSGHDSRVAPVIVSTALGTLLTLVFAGGLYSFFKA